MKTKTEKIQDKSKSIARCPTRVPCQVAHGDSERLQSHTDALLRAFTKQQLRRHSPQPGISVSRESGCLFFGPSPKAEPVNPRAEPEHYIRALATAEAEKNEGAGAEPLVAVTMPTRTNRAPGPLHRGDLTHEFPLLHARGLG